MADKIKKDVQKFNKIITGKKRIVPRDPQTARHIYTPTAEEEKYFTTPKFVCYAIDDKGFYVIFRGEKRKLTETKHFNTLIEALKQIK